MKVAVVGVCASGKTTLVSALRQFGIDAVDVAQEHSLVPHMWQVITRPDVLIYLDAGLQKRVVPVLHYALNPGGYLLLGSSETVGPFTDLFAAVDARHRIYSEPRHGARALALSRPRGLGGRAAAAPAPRARTCRPGHQRRPTYAAAGACARLERLGSDRPA